MNAKEFEEKYPGGIKFECTKFGDSEPQYMSVKCSKCNKYATYSQWIPYSPYIYFCDDHKPNDKQL